MRFAQPLEEILTTQSYPTTTDALIAQHGDLEFDHPNGTVTLGTVLAHVPNEPIETVDEGRLLVWGSFDELAIGRKAYSDRDPPNASESTHRPISF